MWLWRGETGLWEQDPATPFNFRGNLLGIAFDPTNPDRGYAVGQGGVLLGYGKTWTQEPLPPQVAGANFTSIAFAGSEAIVAYRSCPIRRATATWRAAGQQRLRLARRRKAPPRRSGANVPEAVAGLPDGGAAFAASGQRTAQTCSSASAARRELAGDADAAARAGASRARSRCFAKAALCARSPRARALNTYTVESETPSPPRLPADPDRALPAGSERRKRRAAPDRRRLERRGARTQQRARTAGRLPRTGTRPISPIPISAVLIDREQAPQGWAVGGFVETEHEGMLDTADIERYPADGVDARRASAARTSRPKPATRRSRSAAARSAQRPAPTAPTRASGPTVAVGGARASRQIAGVRAFLYTGPRVTERRNGRARRRCRSPTRASCALRRLLAATIPAYAAPHRAISPAAQASRSFDAGLRGLSGAVRQGLRPARWSRRSRREDMRIAARRARPTTRWTRTAPRAPCA